MSKLKIKKIIMTVMALTLLAVLVVGTTFSWIESGDKAYVNRNNITITSGSSLTMRQDEVITSSITIPGGTLEPVSSADGRTYFFPLAGNTSSNTTEMVFREGVPSDKNTRYKVVDFQLEAGEKATDVYLGAGTIVECTNPKVMEALRISFSYNDGREPVVFKPNQMPGEVNMKYYPVTAITSDGVPTVSQTGVTTEAYGDYYYKGDAESTPLFHLGVKETIDVTLSIWLEGTAFTGNDIKDANISIYIDFSTTVDELVKYTFVDNTHDRGTAEVTHWVGNNIEEGTANYKTMMYIYDAEYERYYAMESQGEGSYTWVGYVPKNINKFYFRRYSIDINNWWNQWEPSMEDIPIVNGERTYVAIAGQEIDEGEHLDGCYGYWKDADDTIRIYFKRNNPLKEAGWGDPYCYYWNSDGDYNEAYPGERMTYSSGSDNEDHYFYIDIPNASELKGVIFSNEHNKDSKIEITDTQYFFNGWITWADSTSSYGHYIYVDELNSLIYPVNDPTP